MSGLQKHKTQQLTERIVAYIDWYVDTFGSSPSFREIGAACDIQSTATVSFHLDRLVSLNRIEFGPKKRTMRLINNGDPKSCKHDWRVRRMDNPLPLKCDACGLTTETHYVASDLAFIGKLR